MFSGRSGKQNCFVSLRKCLVNIGKCYFLTAGSALTLYVFVPYTFEAFVDFIFR